MKAPWLLSTILLITAALGDPVVHDDATTKRQLEFLQNHPYLFPPEGHWAYQEIKRRLGEIETVSAPDKQVTTDPNSSDETRLLAKDKPDPEEKLKEYEASFQEVKRRLGELETVSAQVTTDPNSHASDEIRLLTEDKPDPLEKLLTGYEAAYQEIRRRLGGLETVSDKQVTTDPNSRASVETRLEEILKEYETGVDETDDLVVSMLSEGDAASTEKFKCAWDEVVCLLRKDLEATTRRRRLLCCSLPPRRKQLRYRNEYHCWGENFGPHFEHRIRVLYVVRQARYYARRAGRPADDYEGMKSSLLAKRIEKTLEPVFSTEKVERAVKVAQQTAILANAVRYHMVHVLRLLLEEGSRRRLLEKESPYEEHYFRIVIKEAARGNDLQILKMLLKFSDAPENFGAALLSAVGPGRKKNGQIIHFLLSHEGSMDEALKLAWFKGMVTKLEEVPEIYGTYRVDCSM